MMTIPVARPDHEANARATRSSFPVVVREVREILGASSPPNFEFHGDVGLP